MENTDILNVDDSIRQDSNETVPIENSGADIAQAINMSQIVSEVKSMNRRLGSVAEESNELREVNCELQKQIVQLKSTLKFEQQLTKSLRDDIMLKDLTIKSQQDQILALQQELEKQASNKRAKNPKTPKDKKFDEGVTVTSTPRSASREKKSTSVQNKSFETSVSKRKLKLRSNKSSGNTIIV